jgi:hypothetical protein
LFLLSLGRNDNDTWIQFPNGEKGIGYYFRRDESEGTSTIAKKKGKASSFAGSFCGSNSSFVKKVIKNQSKPNRKSEFDQ